MFRAIQCMLRFPVLRTGLARHSSTISPLLHNLFQTCRSCGVKLQDTDKSAPGFYQITEPKPFSKPEDQVYNKHLSKASPEIQELLLKGKSASVPRNKHSSADKSEIECQRCRDVEYRSQAKFKGTQVDQEFPRESLDTVIEKFVPPDGKIVYIANYYDMPISLNSDIFKHRKAHDIKFVVTKADLVFKTNSLAIKYGMQFIQDYLERKYGVPPQNVLVVSAKNDWNIDVLSKFIDDSSYLVGNVNSGKSSLTKSLLFHEAKKKKSFRTSREEIIAQKEQDAKINNWDTKRRYLVSAAYKELETKFKTASGPGVSYVPGFTRGIIPIYLDTKTIYDVPGFVNSTEAGNLQYYKMVENPSVFKNINKGCPVFKRGTHEATYQTIRSGRAANLGGLLFMQFPKDSLYQLRNCINHDINVFKNIDNMRYVATNLRSYINFKQYFLVKHDEKSFAGLVRYVIPPFYGTVDLVVQGLGHINIKPTGAKKTNELIVVYAVPGLELAIRQPIMEYIAKSFTQRNKNGDLLSKEKWVTDSTFALKRYTAKDPFYSKLVRSENTGEYASRRVSDYDAVASFVHLGKGSKLPYDDTTVLTPKNQYDYWVE